MRIIVLAVIAFCQVAYASDKELKDAIGGIINSRDVCGRTLLHHIVMLPHKSTYVTDSHELDKLKAQWSAQFILRGAHVYIKDWADKTPICLARKYKQTFPLTYKVVLAGYIKEGYECRLPKPRNGQNYSDDELSTITMLFSPMDLDSWARSLETLKNFSHQSKL